jgi:hypothetical protein
METKKSFGGSAKETKSGVKSANLRKNVSMEPSYSKILHAAIRC